MNEYAQLLDGLRKHLITSGLTFNAEVATDPIITRPVRVEVLVATVMEYLNATGYANTTRIS
jgi:alpha-beta hydrolase superfamily lysophospholipase